MKINDKFENGLNQICFERLKKKQEQNGLFTHNEGTK